MSAAPVDINRLVEYAAKVWAQYTPEERAATSLQNLTVDLGKQVAGGATSYTWNEEYSREHKLARKGTLKY